MNNRRSAQMSFAVLLRRNEQGIALPMVLIVFIVGFALVTAFMVAIVGSANVSNTTRSGIQAQAAAEAGIAAALTAENICDTPSPDSRSDVVYSTSVECDLAAAEPTAVIKSHGDARDGTTAVVERVVKLNVTTAGGGGGSPLYTAENMTLGGNADIQAADAEYPPNIFVDGRDFNCAGSAGLAGSVFVSAGSVVIGGACVIRGDIKSMGDVTVEGGGKVLGSIESQGNVKLSGWSGVHAQSVKAAGNVILEGSAQTVDVSAGQNLTMGGNTKVTTATVRGTVSLSGSASIANPTIGTQPLPVPLPPSPPPFPEMTLAAITGTHAAPTWQTIAWSGDCTVNGDSHPMRTRIAASTGPVMINAMNCDEVTFTSNASVSFRSDVTIVSKSFHLSTYNLHAGDGKAHTLRFMVPFDQACTGSLGKIRANNFKFSEPLIALAYAKCGVDLGNGSTAYWPGSLITKNFTGTPLMKYVPVSPDPTKSATGGGGGGEVTSVTVESTLSQRNIDEM